MYIRSKMVLDARAASVSLAIGGIWVDIDDMRGLTAYAMENRELGYNGFYVIHPAHIAPINEVFTPSEAEIDYYKEVIEAFDRGSAEGRGAVVVRGGMVDHAMARSARELLGAVGSGSATTLGRTTELVRKVEDADA